MVFSINNGHLLDITLYCLHSPGVVVGGVLLACDQLLGVEQLPVGADPHLVNHGGLEVHKHGPGKNKQR